MIHVFATLGVLLVLAGTAGAQSGEVPDGVYIEKSGAGAYFLTQEQQSLYWNEREVDSGEVTCLEECIEIWHPLQAEASDQSLGQWVVIKRPDGILQWAYQGKPLYTFINDTFPGARLGDGRARSWNVLFDPIDVPAGMTIEATVLGFVLADHRGRTLYTRTPSTATGKQKALEEPDHWTPFNAPWLALDQGEWSIKSLDGVARQWAYEGRLLFTYKKDSDSHDVHGHGLDEEWSAVILEPAPALPSWMTVQQIDLGLAYANEQGLTIYAPVDINAIKVAQTCPQECMQEFWRPILPKAGDSSVGNWVIVDNDNGQKQWSYKGQLLYTHTRDMKPGEMKGNGIGVGYRIGDGWRIIPVETGQRRSRS